MLVRARELQAQRRAHTDGRSPYPAMAKLRATVMLAGSVRATRLRKATGRCALELPVTESQQVLDTWRRQIRSVTDEFELKRMPVRIMIDHGADMAPSQLRHGPLQLSIEQDPSELRGTGGLLSDLAREYRDEEYLLVINGSQLLYQPLADLVASLVSAEADVALLCSPDGRPAGVTLIRCGCLRSIKPLGYNDLYEQALPQIAKDHTVRAVRQSGLITLPIRSLDGYVTALREYHRRGLHLNPIDPSHPPREVEDWQTTFRIIEAGARVHERAIVHDAVVLKGAAVDTGAVVVRSVVCEDATVTAGQSVVDRLFGSGSGIRSET